MNTNNTTPLRRKTDQPGANSAILQRVEQHWQDARGIRNIPARNDIAPDQIAQDLPHTFVLQLVAPGVARMRVAGQTLHEMLKMDARGMPISALFRPQARPKINMLVATALQEPAITALPLESVGGLMRPPLQGTMLLLPLTDAEGATTRVLGALDVQGTIGSRARRFQIPQGAHIRHERLDLHLAISGKATVRRDAKRPDTQRPALRLIINNG